MPDITSKYVTTDVLGKLTENGDILTKDYAARLFCTLTALQNVVTDLQDILSGATAALVEDTDDQS